MARDVVSLPPSPVEERTPRPRTWWRGALPWFTLGLLLGFTAALAVQQLIATDGPRAMVLRPGPWDPNPDITITLSGGLLTALIQREINRGESPLQLEDVRVEPQDGVLVVRGDVIVLRRAVGATIALEPFLEDGVLRFRVVQARLGPLPVPNNVERLVERPINRQVETALGDLPATVTGVRTTPEGVTVTARVRVEELN